MKIIKSFFGGSRGAVFSKKAPLAAGGKEKNSRQNPYKGLFSYKEEDKDLFYGRSEETQRLSQLVKFNFLTVVVGKSGIGKTSLLNAGVFPRLRDDGYLPISVRLNYSPEAPPLEEQIREEILKVIPEEAAPFDPTETLWEYFHRVSHLDSTGEGEGKEVIPILMLDQFEELFTLGKNHKDRDNLVDELYWLLENQFPTPHRERILTDDKGEKRYTFSTARPEMRVIISLREDYLAHLNELKTRISSIDRTLFRVIHLNGRQAREVIGMPGGFREDEVIDNILRRFYPEGTPLGETIPDEKLEIEPSILSLLCHQLFEKQTFGPITQEDQDRVLVDFYNSVIKSVPGEVKRFLESKLLTEKGFRTPYYLEPGYILRPFLKKLEDRRVLRRYYDGKKEYIEIIHDVLAPVIYEKRHYAIKDVIIVILSCLLMVFVGVTIFAFYQMHRAKEQFQNFNTYRTNKILNIADEALMELSKDNTRALRIAEGAYRMGLPDPLPRASQVLSTVGYSYLEKNSHTSTPHHDKMINSVVFSPDGTRILTASSDNTAKLWNLEGHKLADLNKHTQKDKDKPVAISAVFSPDGSRILTASSDKTAKLWDLGGNLLADLNKHKDAVISAVFSPDGTRILTASSDNTAKLWDLEGKLLADLNKHKSVVRTAVFSPDGSRILTASLDNTAKIWLTPEAIYEWLKTAPLPQLSEEDKKELGIQ